MTIIDAEDYNTVEWVGGKSTELFIYPKTSTVQHRDFEFRISTATIEIEESIFSEFSGYLRKIMVLSGQLTLNHEQQHSCVLNPFDQDEFSGDWKTTSVGKATDFNVIYRPYLNPTVEKIDCIGFDYTTLSLHPQNFIYVLNGTLNLMGETIAKNSSAFVETTAGLEIEIKNSVSLLVVRF